VGQEDFEKFLEGINLKERYEVSTAVCPNCKNKKFTLPSKFNLLMSTNIGSVEDKSSSSFLRPETCQGIFVNFPFIQKSSRKKLPFGIGQIGKSFRNEITLNHGIFRTREFEQMEMEFFCKGEESDH
jgi:glycyl-tRNA synthetase